MKYTFLLTDSVIDGKVFDETVYLLFEVLSGFTELDGNVFQVKFRAIDNENKIPWSMMIYSVPMQKQLLFADSKHIYISGIPGQLLIGKCEAILFDRKEFKYKSDSRY
jgi:hypothetical protein